jgi:mercuric ion transport protein
MRRNGLFISSILAAVGASLCCILPLVAIVTGAGTLAAAAQLESYRPFLLALTGVLFVSGLLFVYRDSRTTCSSEGICAPNGSRNWNLRSLFCIASLVIGIAIFPYLSSPAVLAMNAGKGKYDGQGLTITKTLSVSGMTCPACANGLEASFRNLSGVEAAEVDYNARLATVTYDPAKQTLDTIKKLVIGSGYQVKD